MKKWMEEFWKEEEAFGTVEMAVLIGVLVAVAFAFKNFLLGDDGFLKKALDKSFKDAID
ncbi:MAG: Flp1 family type IVb pilin [bacterium]|nr:Flp1 family type IVb pilin [bacterium]